MTTRLVPGLVLTAALLAPAYAVLPQGASAAAAAAPTCDRLPATIVGVPGQRLDGTPGPDVILTNGAISIDAGAGDDVMCLSGRAPHDGTGQTTSGDGDDRVYAVTSQDWIVDLGDGADEFYGGPGDEEVYPDGYSDEHGVRDTIRTGAGNDSVTSDFGLVEWNDDIDLGPGDDFAYGSMLGSGARLVGGDGVDYLEAEGRLFGADLGRTPWTIVNTPDAGTATAAGQERMHWAGFEQFWFDVFAPLSFTGSDLDEYVQVNRFTGADLGGGDDVLEVRGTLGGDIVGGTGDDELIDTGCHGVLDLDLDRRRGACLPADAAAADDTAAIDDKSRTVLVDGLESLDLLVRDVRLRGTSGPDRFRVLACAGTVRGLGGDDVIINRLVPYSSAVPCEHGDAPTRLYGGKGDDRLTGSEYADVLSGGPGDDILRGRRGGDVLIGGGGRDEAAGGTGRDRCVAESTRRCEA